MHSVVLSRYCRMLAEVVSCNFTCNLLTWGEQVSGAKSMTEMVRDHMRDSKHFQFSCIITVLI